MRHAVCILVLFIPFVVRAQEHKVPIATEGNLYMLAVQNTGETALNEVRIAVRSAPEWLVFRSSLVSIAAIPANDERQAEFKFDVLDVQPEQVGSVKFVITYSKGGILGSGLLKVRTFALPKTTRLEPPFPNPANPGTSIQYSLHTSSKVKIEIYNLIGQLVRKLLDEEKPAGTFTVQWDGKNTYGISVSSGAYIIRLTSTEQSNHKVRQFTSKLIIQK